MKDCGMNCGKCIVCRLNSPFMRGMLLNLLAVLIIALPCWAAVVSNSTVPSTRSTGDTVTASIWNSDALGLYSYLNNNIVPALNTLTTKGDLYVYTGAALARQGIGADGTVLTADSAQANGIKWAALANTVALTTKGDLLGFSTVPLRVAVGTDGQTLIADSTQSAGIKWGTPTTSIPKGTVTAWSPAAAGTNTVPTGWLLCDGTSSTPNLIGRFIIGTRPAASTATGSAGSFTPIPTVDGNGGGVTSHTHTVGNTIATGFPVGTSTVQSGTGTTVASSTHQHSAAVAGVSNSASNEPADYALVYIIKQ